MSTFENWEEKDQTKHLLIADGVSNYSKNASQDYTVLELKFWYYLHVYFEYKTHSR